MSTEIKPIAGSRNISHKKGNSLRTIQITLKLNGTPLDLTGHTYSLKIFSASDPAETGIVTLTEGNGLTVDPTAGKITITHIPEINTLNEGTYEYSLDETTTSTGLIDTIIEGLFLIYLSN